MQNLADILRSQPRLKNVDKNISRLKKIHHLWPELINLANTNAQFSNLRALEQYIPISVQQHTLHISCESAVLASHARFIAPILLTALNSKGIQDISYVHVSLTGSQQSNEQDEQTTPTITRTISADTIKVLQQFRQSCASEELGESINRLLTQLKKDQ